MASRFTDTELWNEDWFCEMGGEYQLFCKYVFDKCDNAGVWKPNKIDFEIKTNFKVSLDSLFQKMNGGAQRVLLLENGRWFLTGYILFQWFNKKKTFDLVLSNRLHLSLYKILTDNQIPLKKVRGLKEVLETSMVMVMDKEGIKEEKGGVGEKEEKRVVKNPNQFPTHESFQHDLPDITIGSVIQLVKIMHRSDLSPPEVVELFQAFKIQNLTGKKFYATPEDVFSHFINWAKSQRYVKPDTGVPGRRAGANKSRGISAEDFERFVNS